jgi:hypothetical protein
MKNLTGKTDLICEPPSGDLLTGRRVPCVHSRVDVAQRYTYWHHTLQRESTPAQTTRQTYSVVTTVESEIVCERERDVLRCEDDTIPCATPSFKNVGNGTWPPLFPKQCLLFALPTVEG